TAFLKRTSSKSFGAEKNSQLQWHVEPRELIRLVVNFCPRNVVDTVITLGNQPIDIFNPNVRCIRQFQCASGHEPAGCDAKDNRIEEPLILFIKRAVDEYASAGGRRHFGLTVSDN